jgi:hypothetical protein
MALIHSTLFWLIAVQSLCMIPVEGKKKFIEKCDLFKEAERFSVQTLHLRNCLLFCF